MPPPLLPDTGIPWRAVAAGAATAASAAIAGTALARAAARRCGFLDAAEPHHGTVRRVPLGGGLAVLSAVVAGTAALGRSGALPADGMHDALRLLACAAAMAALGLWDDLRPLGPAAKMAGQTIVAGAAYLLLRDRGLRISLAGDAEPLVGIATVGWIVAVTNAFNLFDHEDGASTGVGAIAAGVLSATAFQTGQEWTGGMLAVLAAALLGFLPHNFPPARIFLGDAGSLSVGFLLGSLTVMQTYYPPDTTPWAFAIPLLCLAVPLFDTALVMGARVRAGRSPFRGDRTHFTHRLIALGMTPREAVLTLYGLAFCLSAVAPLLYALPDAVAQVALLQAVGILSLTALLERAGRRRRAPR